VVERVPASGSCARCRAALGLASVRVDGRWYCSAACAEGDAPPGRRETSVPEPWLYCRPQRFFRKRRPRELNTSPRN